MNIFGVIWGLGATLNRIRGRIEQLETAPRPDGELDLPGKVELVAHQVNSHDTRIEQMETDVTDLETQNKEFVLALAEGIERVDRAHRRISATVKRARKELKALGYESAGLEAEDHDLESIDGNRSEEGELRVVQPPVESGAEQASSVPGVTLALMRRARGW